MEQTTFELTLANYFRERLQTTSAQLAPDLQEDTLWYVGNMLARFGDSNQLFCYDEGSVSLRPLALLYRDAHETRVHSERCLILRQLGDLSLFLGALFPRNFARRGLQTNYLVGMGGGAYDYLADNAADNRHIFTELAATFVRLLELIARACECRDGVEATDVLALYQRFRDTRDPYLAAQLRALGIDIEGSNTLH